MSPSTRRMAGMLEQITRGADPLLSPFLNHARAKLLTIELQSPVLRGAMHFFRNQGDGSFVERTAEAGLAGLVGGLNMISGDYNIDGLVDVFILRGGWMGKGGMHPDSGLEQPLVR